jgi:hypothetical protein
MQEQNNIESQKASRKYNQSYDNFIYAYRRSNELADKFSSLQITIATILIALSGALITSTNFSADYYLAGIWSLLTLSTLFGLINIPIAQKMWNGVIQTEKLRMAEWEEYTTGTTTMAHALKMEHHICSSEKRTSSSWAWKLQLLSLILGMIGMLVWAILQI